MQLPRSSWRRTAPNLPAPVRLRSGADADGAVGVPPTVGRVAPSGSPEPLAKFGIGTYEYLAGVRDTGGFGEVMVMIAVMVAVQAEIVWRRAQRVAGATDVVTSAPHEAVAA